MQSIPNWIFIIPKYEFKKEKIAYFKLTYTTINFYYYLPKNENSFLLFVTEKICKNGQTISTNLRVIRVKNITCNIPEIVNFSLF